MVLASDKHSPSRNRLLSVLSDDDFALLQPHLRPVALPLLYDLERPNRKIECLFYGGRHGFDRRRPVRRDPR